MAIHVLQGERELVDDCRSLARFELRGIPAMAAGAAKIRVTFQVDADGLLEVSAREITSGVATSVQVKPSYGLAEEQIAEMIKASWQHVDEDRSQRHLKEQQVEAARLLDAINTAMQSDGDKLLSATEKTLIIQGMEALIAVKNGTDHHAIAKQIEELAKTTNEFAARRMDDNIKQALAGQSVDAL